MRYLSGEEEREAQAYFRECARVAVQSNCHRARCGSVIVKDGELIGTGVNSPPLNECIERCLKDDLPKDFISDRTCCVHAEDRAVRDALQRNPGKLQGARLYFARLAENGDVARAGRPYCTWCSKTALDASIAEFVLWHDEGICAYDTREYNQLSFQHLT